MSKIYICDRCHCQNTMEDDIVPFLIDKDDDGLRSKSYYYKGDLCHNCMRALIDFIKPLPLVSIMIPHDQPLRKETIEKMLRVCNDEIGNGVLTDKWESDFIESIASQFEKKSDLTDSQCEILERIYDKI